MQMDVNELKQTLKTIAETDPTFFRQLLGDSCLMNPFPYDPDNPRIHVDPTSRIRSCAHIELTSPDTQIEIGPHCEIDDFSWLRAWGSGIKMGAHCTIRQYTMVQGGVSFGDGVRIGAHSVFVATDHKIGRTDIPIHKQGCTHQDIAVGDDVYVGSNVTVLQGVTIGRGAVLAAGAVVKHDVAPFTVVGGVPAKLIRQRQ